MAAWSCKVMVVRNFDAGIVPVFTIIFIDMLLGITFEVSRPLVPDYRVLYQGSRARTI